MLTMSGSRTAVPITAVGPPASPLSAPASESATRSSRASDDIGVTQERWWSEEDLRGAAAERSRSQQDRATRGGQLSPGTQPKLQSTNSSSRQTPGLRPTASLFTPASSLPAKRASELDSAALQPHPTEEGFHYNHEEYRRSSPDKFIYPTGLTEPPFGADLEHAVPSSGSGTGLRTPNFDSPLLSAEEKAKVAQLASLPKATKAVPIKAPASASSKALAAADANSARHGASSEPVTGPYDLEAKSSPNTPNLPLPSSPPPSSMTSGSAAFLTARTSPNRSRTSLTSSIRSTRSGSSFSASLVPYEGSSEEDETSSEAEKQSATPIADASLELPTTPPEDSAAACEPEKPEPKAESDVSLEDQIRPAMAVSDVEPEKESEGLFGALAQPPNQAAANAEPLGDGDKHESTTGQLAAIPSGSGYSAQGVTSEASVLAQNTSEGVPSETEKVPSSALPCSPSTASEIPMADAAVAPVHVTDKVETIGSETAQRDLPAVDSRAPPPSPTSTFSDMPAFNLDQRIRSFNPFAAPFVPPTAHQPGSGIQSIASGTAASGLVPPSAVIGQAYTLGPFGPVAPITAKPMGPADIQCQTLGNLLRQAMHENGVLHHKIAKYDHGLKAEQERRATIARELDEFKAEHNRVLRNGKPTPIQQRQVADLEATIARGNGELERLRHELNAMGTSLARVQKEHAASMKREKDTLTSEQRKWEVAVKMRDERIEALQQQHQADEQKLETMRAEHEAEAARLKDDLESEWKKRANARDSATDATRERLEQTIASQEAAESQLHDSEAEQEQLRLDRDKLRDELDDVKHRHETLLRLHEGQKDVLETQSKKLKEAVAQQELLRTSLTVCQDELATSRQEEKKARETRDRFGTMLKATSQEKTEIERKFRAELDKLQREKADVEAKLNAELDKLVKELDLLKKDLTDAVREIVHVEGERDKSDTIAVDSFECALSGMQSLRRLLNEEQRHTSDLEADYDKLKTACSNRIEQLEQLLRGRDVELEEAKKANGDGAADNAAKQELSSTKALLKQFEDERTRLKLERDDNLEQRRKLETQLGAERAENERLHRDVERLQKLADQHKAAELAAFETSHDLKKKVSDLEDRQTTLGSLLVEAKAERDAFSQAEAQLRAERAGNSRLRSDVESLQKLANQHKGAQLAALEASSQLTKKVSDLEDRQTTLGGLLVGARAERDTASKQLEDARREKAQAEDARADAERKIAMLEDKVESLVSELEAAKAGGRLAAEVHKAGGFGYIGAGHKPFDTLVEDVRLARETLSLPPNDDLPIGVGFMGWKFEPPQFEKGGGIKEGERWLSYIIHEAKARSVWISFANDLKAWVDRARDIENTGSDGAPTRKEKLLIAIMVHSADKAKEASSWENVDAIVLQGTEAGGHGADFEHGAPLDELLDAVLKEKSAPSQSRPLILAAGGISSPAAVAKYLGREGVTAVVPGTALCVADESTLSEPQKKLLVEAKDGDTETGRSVRWDIARGTTGWPVGVDGRGLRDAVSESSGEVQKGGPPVTWAGTGVGDVKQTGPVADILHHLTSAYEREASSRL